MNQLIATVKKKPRNPFLSMLLSLAVTGLGQAYNGDAWKGIALLSLRTIAIILIPFNVIMRPADSHIAPFSILIAVSALVSAAAPLESFIRARRSREITMKRCNTWYFYSAFAAAACIITGASVFTLGLFFSIERLGNDAIPAVLEGEYILVKRYSPEGFSRGDLVRYGERSIGRIIAMPESTVMVRNNLFYIDGTPLQFGLCREDEMAHFPEELRQNILTEKNSGREYPIMAQPFKDQAKRRMFSLDKDHYLLAGDNRLEDLKIFEVGKSGIKGRVEGVLFSTNPSRILIKPFRSR